MKAKILLISCLFSLCAIAQVNTELSDAGKRHYKAAMTLFDMASTIEDYKAVAKEFELVAETDPNYADTYFNLGKIYTKLGKEHGEPYFKKAKDAFNKYKELRPAEANTADDEIYAIDLVEKTSAKSRAEKKKAAFVGTWKGDKVTDFILKISEVEGVLKAFVTICDGRALETYGEKFDGNILTFQVRDTDLGDGQIYRVECQGWSGDCDFETNIYNWRCELKDDKLKIFYDWRSNHSLRGRYVGTCSSEYSNIYIKQ